MWWLSFTSLVGLMIAGRIWADQHHLFVASFTSPRIFALEFDDQTNSIVQTGNTIAHDGHPWISFSYDKAALYAGERNGFASYSVQNQSALEYKKSVSLKGACGNNTKDFGSTYVLPLLKAPFTVYGAPFGSCIDTMNVAIDGTLQEVVQSSTLDQNSTIHGMAMDSTGEWLYSADDAADGIWIHRVNPRSGELEQAVSFAWTPYPGAQPRHLVAHPLGKYLYVLLEKRSELAVYAINYGTKMNSERLTFTGVTYSLLPKGIDPTDYQADEVVLSVDNNILFASTRYRQTQTPGQAGSPKESKDDKTNTKYPTFYQKRASKPGYITAILLVPQSELGNTVRGHEAGPGFPLRQLFQTQTTTSGGMSNAISPSPFDNDYFAVSDSEIGQVEIWKISGASADRSFYNGSVAQDTVTPPQGFWENGNWNVDFKPKAPEPSATSAPAQQVPTANPAPFTGGNPFQEGQGQVPYNPWLTQPKNPYTPKQGGNPWTNPWAPKATSNPYGWVSPWGQTPRDGDSDDDDDYRETKISGFRRQASNQAGVPAPSKQVTAHVVATWKAPTRDMRTSRLKHVRRQVLPGITPSINMTALRIGGCCGNALWFD